MKWVPDILATLISLTLVLVGIGHAAARDNAVPIGLHVSSTADTCPDTEILALQTASHLGHDPFVRGHANPSVQVIYTQTERGFAAEIRLVGARGFSGTRHLDVGTPDCAQLGASVSVVIAMALEEALAQGALYPTRRPRDEGEARVARAESELPRASSPRQAPASPWRYAIGASVGADAFLSPRANLGGGLVGRMTKQALALELHLRAGGSFGSDTLPAALVVAIEPRVCLALGDLDLCGGIAAGFQTFETAGLVTLDPPARATHVAGTVAVGWRLELGSVTLRPALLAGIPFTRPRLTLDGAPLWQAPPAFGGVHLTVFFGSP